MLRKSSVCESEKPMSKQNPISQTTVKKYCTIHDEEIRWICFHIDHSDKICENNHLCIYCRKEHNPLHFNKIESTDFLKSDYIKSVIKKESDKIQNAKEIKLYLLELKNRINKLIDDKLENLESINENYNLEKNLEKYEILNRKITQSKINEINIDDIKFFDETMNLIFSLKTKNKIVPGENKNIPHEKSSRKSSINSNINSPSENLNLETPNKSLHRSNTISNYYKMSKTNNIDYLKESKLPSLNPDQIWIPQIFTMNLEDLMSKIIQEFSNMNVKSPLLLNNPVEKFLWDDKYLAELTSINKENDLITIQRTKSQTHNSVKSIQQFTSGVFSTKILIEEMICCGGVGVGYGQFIPNGRRDVLCNNYTYFSDGKIAGNIKVENLPKFFEGDIVMICCDIESKEISFFLNSKSVYTIKNADFRENIYVIGDLDGGKLRFIS